MKCFLLLLACMGTAGWVAAQPAQVILIRHAEKPADPAALHLSKEGEKRAKSLVPFLTTDARVLQHGTPVALFAAKTTKHGHAQRTQETVAPLAKKLGLRVQTPYLSEDYRDLAHSILSNPKFLGKTVLICWVHESIPQLAAALGVSPQPPKWKDAVYDQVYLISYEGKKAKLEEFSE